MNYINRFCCRIHLLCQNIKSTKNNIKNKIKAKYQNIKKKYLAIYHITHTELAECAIENKFKKCSFQELVIKIKNKKHIDKITTEIRKLAGELDEFGVGADIGLLSILGDYFLAKYYLFNVFRVAKFTFRRSNYIGIIGFIDFFYVCGWIEKFIKIDSYEWIDSICNKEYSLGFKPKFCLAWNSEIDEGNEEMNKELMKRRREILAEVLKNKYIPLTHEWCVAIIAKGLWQKRKIIKTCQRQKIIIEARKKLEKKKLEEKE